MEQVLGLKCYICHTDNNESCMNELYDCPADQAYDRCMTTIYKSRKSNMNILYITFINVNHCAIFQFVPLIRQPLMGNTSRRNVPLRRVTYVVWARSILPISNRTVKHPPRIVHSVVQRMGAIRTQRRRHFIRPVYN